MLHQQHNHADNMNVLVAVRGGAYGKITVYGRAGHAELTQPHWKEGGAVNAIIKAMKIIQAFEDFPQAPFIL